MKKLFGFGLAAVLSFAIVSPANAVDAWRPDSDSLNAAGVSSNYVKGDSWVLITEEMEVQGSSLFWKSADKKKMAVCETLGKNLNCGQNTPGEFFGEALLPVCGEVVENCISKVWIYTEGSTKSEAVFSHSSKGFTYAGDASRGIPRGSGHQIFESPTLHSAGTGTYAISAVARIAGNSNASGTFFNIMSFDLKVAPVIERPDPRGKVHSIAICTNPFGLQTNCGENIPNCIYGDVGVCGAEQQFSPNTRVAVELKLSNSVTGWFRGRVKDPSIAVERINSKYNLVTVDASTVEVPRFFGVVQVSKGDPDLLAKVDKQYGYGGQYVMIDPNREVGFQTLNAFRDWVKDTSAGVSTQWYLGTISSSMVSQGSQKINQCLSDDSRLLGIVTTNSTVYDGGVPKFSGGFLNYRVGGLHYLPDGKTEVLGNYDLVMRSDVARCLYNFNKAPVSATVTVTGGSSQNVATTVVSEKNGWLKLAAYGFTFSEKTIKVKLTQKKTTVVCVNSKNSKLTKKVTGYNPTCPAGYTKK